MDIKIHGRNVGITERFENYVEAKAQKVENLLPKAQDFDVKVSRVSERNPQSGDQIEITIIGPGPVIRAEAEGSDKYAAFDVAFGRVLERIRRSKDRRTGRRGRGRTSLGDAASHDFDGIDVTPASLETIEAVANGTAPAVDDDGAEDVYTPVVIRSKEFPAAKMSVEEAVDQMELVGHDFFLFVEEGTEKASVVYRRKGWNYGVISLADE